MATLGSFRPLVLAAALVLMGLAPCGRAAAETGGPASSRPSAGPTASTLTLKERSSGKAMDEQRVNDCKVPFDQRGDHRRSADCTAR